MNLFASSIRGCLSGVLVLASYTVAASFVATAATACPSGPQQENIKAEMLSEWPDPAEPIDYLRFFQSPKASLGCLVVLSRQDHGSSHAAGATISIAEVSAVGDTWKRTLFQKDVVSIGSFGNAPEPTLILLGKTTLALRFDLVGMHFGYIGKTLVLVAKVGGQYKEILSVQVHGDNSGVGDEDAPQWGWDAQMTIQDSNKSPFPPLRFTYTGTNEVDGTIRPLDTSEVYEFAGDEYALRTEERPTPVSPQTPPQD